MRERFPRVFGLRRQTEQCSPPAPERERPVADSNGITGRTGKTTSFASTDTVGDDVRKRFCNAGEFELKMVDRDSFFPSGRSFQIEFSACCPWRGLVQHLIVY